MSRPGEYRAIPKGLCDQPEYQAVTPHAKLVYLTLRIGLSAAGIAVRHPEALAHQLAEQTGLKVDNVRVALEVLEHHDVIKRDGNVLWVVQQLADDPLTSSNPKHRKSIQSVIDALPRNTVVGQFIRHYREWFAEDSGKLAQPYLWAGDRVAKPKRYPSATSTPHHTTTKHSNSANAAAGAEAGESEPEPPPPDPRRTDQPDSWPASWAFDTAQRLLSHDVSIGTGEIGNHGKAFKGKMPWDEWLRVIDRLAATGDCAFGFPSAMRRVKNHRDSAVPDPNRELTLEEAMAI